MSDSIRDRIEAVLSEAYSRVLNAVEVGGIKDLIEALPQEIRDDLVYISKTRHNGRGVALTLLAYKLANPSQDITAHKAEHENGFNARSIDTDVVIPKLREWGVHAAGESHWLTQIFSGSRFEAGQILSTMPRDVGRRLPSLICRMNQENPDVVEDALAVLVLGLVEERNRSEIALTKPKVVTIELVLDLLRDHFTHRYKSGSPRLPQIAMYAIYQCLMQDSRRYEEHELVPLERMKTANRKSGTVGDVDVLFEGRVVEAVEIKYGMSVSARHVSDAIEKIKSEDVRRYYILATEGVEQGEGPSIQGMIAEFYRVNGCEIIVNGIYETLKYYMRLLNDIDNFLALYLDVLRVDQDVSYEHRVAWNAICEKRLKI